MGRWQNIGCQNVGEPLWDLTLLKVVIHKKAVGKIGAVAYGLTIQCVTNKIFLTEYEYEYIRSRDFKQIRIRIYSV